MDIWTPLHVLEALLQWDFELLSFRCTVCHTTLLPQSYTQGSDAGSFICTYHTADSKGTRVDASEQTGSQSKLQPVYYSLAGLPITSIPHYTKKTESQARLVCKTAETGGIKSQEENREDKNREIGDSSVAPAELPSSTINTQIINISPAAGK